MEKKEETGDNLFSESPSKKSISGTFIFWISVSFLIIIFWGIFVYTQFCYMKGNGYLFLLIISHFIVLSFFIVSTIISYKIYKMQLIFREKAIEYNNKKEWEELQRKLYKEEKEMQNEDEELDKKIKKVFKDIIAEQERTYKENLKSLKDNMAIYNEVKKIIEEKEPN